MSYIECPECGIFNLDLAIKCQKCGISFQKEEALEDILDSKIMYIFASTMDEAQLAIGENYERYVKRIDVTAPYGRDIKGFAHLFPMEGKNEGEVAYREGMTPKSDYYRAEMLKKKGMSRRK